MILSHKSWPLRIVCNGVVQRHLNLARRVLCPVSLAILFQSAWPSSQMAEGFTTPPKILPPSSAVCVLVHHPRATSQGSCLQSLTHMACSLGLSLFKWSLFPAVGSRGIRSCPPTIVRGEFAALHVSEMCSKKAPSSIYIDVYSQYLKAGNKSELKSRNRTGTTQKGASQVHLRPDAKD